ncbi:phage terminase small subunit P27 family [Staphylococcus saprophyticus]|nr:phage terminase small subunit P27 family [Staphylococcus saprophyticus]
MSQRKLLSQQKAYRTKDVQEQKKATEEVMNGLTPLSKEPPDFLDDDAIQEWYRVLPFINELPIKDLDKGLLATYCQTYSNYKNATLKIQEEGMVVVTERGSKLSPNYTIQRDSVNTMNAICPKLGLTVESRLKIMEPKPKQQYDPFSAFFEDGKKPQSVYEEFGMDNND